MNMDNNENKLRVVIGTSAGVASLFEVNRKLVHVWTVTVSRTAIPIEFLFRRNDILVVSQTDGEV